jgi:hypothetical protein
VLPYNNILVGAYALPANIILCEEFMTRIGENNHVTRELVLVIWI